MQPVTPQIATVGERVAHSILLTIPSARGVHPMTFGEVLNLQNEIQALGHKFYHAELYRLLLDQARNEFVTAFMSGTSCDLQLCLDDDVQVEPKHFGIMLEAIDNGAAIVTAPCRMRSEGNLFNIIPTTEITQLGKARVVECAWTGFGCVLIHRRVWEKFYEHYKALEEKPACKECGHKERHLYRSTIVPGARSMDVFRSEVVPARRFFLEAPEEQNEYVLDDRVFSLKALELGFKIHATIDVATKHDGIAGQFSAELERIQNAQKRAAMMGDGRAILDPTGKPVKR